MRDERVIMEGTVDALLKAGYELTVFDGKYETVTRTTVRDAILAGMRTTDQDFILAYQGDRQDAQGWVRFVYANSGRDLINYTSSLESVMAPVNELAESFS